MAFLGDRGGGPRLWDHGPPSLRLYFVISRRPEGQPPILSPSEELSWDFRTGARSPRAPPSAPRLSLTSLSDDPRAAENARGSSGRLRAAWFMGPPPHGAPSQEHRRAVPTTQDADSLSTTHILQSPSGLLPARLLLQDRGGRPVLCGHCLPGSALLEVEHPVTRGNVSEQSSASGSTSVSPKVPDHISCGRRAQAGLPPRVLRACVLRGGWLRVCLKFRWQRADVWPKLDPCPAFTLVPESAIGR